MREIRLLESVQYYGDGLYRAPAVDECGVKCWVIWKIPYREVQRQKEATNPAFDWEQPYAITDESGNDFTNNAKIINLPQYVF